MLGETGFNFNIDRIKEAMVSKEINHPNGGTYLGDKRGPLNLGGKGNRFDMQCDACRIVYTVCERRLADYMIRIPDFGEHVDPWCEECKGTLRPSAIFAQHGGYRQARDEWKGHLHRNIYTELVNMDRMAGRGNMSHSQ